MNDVPGKGSGIVVAYYKSVCPAFCGSGQGKAGISTGALGRKGNPSTSIKKKGSLKETI